MLCLTVLASAIISPEFARGSVVAPSAFDNSIIASNFDDVGEKAVSPPSEAIDYRESLRILIAAPENLNPAFYLTPPDVQNDSLNGASDDGRSDELSDEQEKLPISDVEDQLVTESSAIDWEDLTIDISDSATNFGQGNRIITPVLRGKLANGNIVSIEPGFNRFSLSDLETVYHVPLTVGWEGAINDVNLAAAGGIDIFNRLPLDTHFDGKVSFPISNDATLSLNLTQGPYLFNAQTLENGISSWRYGPDLFWQIDSKTSLFSLLRIGNFSDGNWEQQSFSRLERQLGEDLSISLNVFNWSFAQDLESQSGYFSPPDFLVATGEVAWQAHIADYLSCRLAGSAGQQRLNGSWVLGYGHQAVCDIEILPSVQMDFGYNYSNVSNGQSVDPGDSAYNNWQVVGGLRSTF